MSSVPIIGVGAVSALGADASATFRAVADGRDGLRKLTLPIGTPRRPVLAARVNDTAADRDSENRTLALALRAAEEALRPLPDRREIRTLLVFATTVGGMTRSEEFYRKLIEDPSHIKQAPRELASHEPTALAGHLCRRFDLQGFLTVSTACSTGLHAVGLAKRLIERGLSDTVLAVGADALATLTVQGFAGLLLLDPNGCRPFDRDRAGISLGEGAGAVLLASPGVVHRRGLDPLALVDGWGATADCYHMTAPDPEGNGARRAVRAALAEAGLHASDIDLIAAHGTGTPDNDISETNAMRSVFGDRHPPVCSMKRTLGHTLAASGTIETVCAVEALRSNTIPRTGGLTTPDEAIGIEAEPKPVSRPLRHVLKNSFGFGGNNAALLLSKPAGNYAARSSEGPTAPDRLRVLGITCLIPSREPGWEDEVPAKTRRRAPRLQQMAYAAVKRVLRETGASPRSLITASALGALEETRAFLDGIYRTGFGSPRSFVASVHNAIGGMPAIEFNINGPNLTFCDGPHSFGCALAAIGLLSPDCFRALLVAVEEQTDLLRKLQPCLAETCGTFLSEDREEGAAALVLDRADPACPAPWLYGTIAIPLGDHQNVDAACRKAAGLPNGADVVYASPLHGPNSTLSSAFRMHELRREGAHGTFVFGTHSPSARSAGAVVLCL